ncbi:MAG: hypothetical protein V2I36_01655 [Desulfopila sp.]|nr:hypothetical protein [Desulfopila sp.]
MSENDIRFLPYERALKIVAAIQEEEDIENKDRRILTVYNYEDKEVCWFDYEQVMEAVQTEGKKPGKEEVQDYILHHIPDWALDI